MDVLEKMAHSDSLIRDIAHTTHNINEISMINKVQYIFNKFML